MDSSYSNWNMKPNKINPLELTDGLHWHIKASLLHYIEDYILFLGDRHDKRSVLSTSNSHFAARYRQLVLVKGGMDDEKLEEFEKEFEEECRREGCAFLFQVDPTSESIEKMDAEGRAGMIIHDSIKFFSEACLFSCQHNYCLLSRSLPTTYPALRTSISV